MFGIKDERLLPYIADYKLNLIIPEEIIAFGYNRELVLDIAQK